MSKKVEKKRAGRNRTVTVSEEEREQLWPRVQRLKDVEKDKRESWCDQTIYGDCVEVASALPVAFVDLMILDPPYNLTKTFGSRQFKRRGVAEYSQWLGVIIDALCPLLKQSATIYVCGDWKSSASIYPVLSQRFKVQNRITWEREKGRGAKRNWKNASEDVWFCTVSDDYTFNVDAVKLRRQVIAPYRKADGAPKGWKEDGSGRYRDTYPSNLWTDITVPFWSMPENTDHPTQKSEKFVSKLILASSHPGDVVMDPFLGSGTTSVVSRKLGRHYVGIEQEEEYAILAEKRLGGCEEGDAVQGYEDGVFWARNAKPR